MVAKLAPWLFATFSVARLFAASDATPTQQVPVIRATVDEVSLDIVVRDKHGRQVRDLRADDVQVVDDGVPVKLNSLRFVDAKNKGALAPDSQLQDFRLVTVVFDRLNTYSQRLARQTVLELIKTAAGPNTFFGIWQIRGGLHLLQSFTNDPQKLNRAVDFVTLTHRITPAPVDKTGLESSRDALNFGAQATGYGAASMLQIEQRLFVLQQNISDTNDTMAREESAHESLGPLLALVREQGSISGRKSLIYVSEGLQVTSDTEQQMQSIIGAANRAGVAIYTLDTSGLNQSALDAAQMSMQASLRPDRYGDATDLIRNNSASLIFQQINPDERDLHNLDASLYANQSAPMRRLASGTGGIFVGDSNDLRPSMRRIVEDMTSYYQATYVPSSREYDGHFRTVAVHVLRPRVLVQSRAGYFSLPPGTGSDVAGFEVPLLKALDSPERKETILFDSSVMRFGGTSAAREAALLVQAPMTGFTAQEDDTTKLFRFRGAVLALIRSKDGRIVQKLSQQMPLQGALGSLAQARKGAFTVQRAFALPPGEYIADVALQDALVKKISSKRFSFTLGPSTQPLSISDMTRVRGADAAPAKGDRSEPLRFHDRRIIPDLLGHNLIPAGPEMPVFFTVYAASGADKPRIELELRQGSELLTTAPLPLPEAKLGDPVPVLTAINTEQLPGGTYSLVAKVHQGGHDVETQLDFTVSGASALVSQRAKQPAAAPEVNVAFFKTPNLGDTSGHVNDAQLQTVLEEARARASQYRQELPNLMCLQVTRRFADSTGTSAWVSKDHFVRSIHYDAGQESSRLVEYNGRKATAEMTQLKGIAVAGVFGDLIDMVLSNNNQSVVRWKGVTLLGSSQTDILDIDVAAQHSGYRLIGSSRGEGATVAFHALVYIDAFTFGVRRIEIEAQNIPDRFPMRQAALSVDYDYLTISEHNYLLPQTATLYVREGAKLLKKNEVEYRDYRKFGSESAVHYAKAP